MRPLLVALVLLGAAGAVRAQDEPRLVTSLSASRVMVGATVVFEVRVVVGAPRPVTFGSLSLPPSLSIVSRQDFSHDQIAVPGGRTRVVQRNFVLAPSRPGVYQIPSMSIDVDGTVLYSDPQTLEVVPGAPAPQPSRRRETEGVRLRALLDAATVYVGQQVILEAEAIFPRDFRQRQTRPATFDTPNPPGFWISELPGGLVGGVRFVDGEVHETQTYRRAYVPLMPGEHVIAPVSLRYEVRRGYLYAPESGELISDSLRLRVLPVPETDRPDSFTGAVGTYSVRASVQPDRVGVGDAATLTVEISGTGNVRTLPPPRLPEMDGVELFPPAEDANVSFRGEQMAGSKRFTWVLVPERPGVVDLGTLSYGFFDPGTERFDIARTVPLRLDVVPVAALNGNAADTALSPVRMQSSRPPLNGLLESPIFAAAQAIPLLALLAVVALRRRRTAPATAQRQLRARWEGALGEMKRDVASDVSAFLGRLTALIRSALAEIAGQDSFRTVSLEALRVELEELGVSAYTATSVTALLRRLDQARFGRTPLDTNERAALVEETQSVLARVQSELRSAMPSAAVRTGVIALLLVGAAASPVTGQNAFRDGVAAYMRGEYAAAGDRFAEHLTASPEDAAAWYNLGNARKGEGRAGEAVLAWRRALEIEPRMTQARHNLRLTGGSAALAGAPPRFAPTTVEAALLLGVLWWIAAGALAWAILRESRFARRMAQATLGIAAIIIVASLPGWLRADVAIALDPLTPLLAGPALRSDTIVTVPAGTPLRVVDREGDWLRVRTSDLAEGWGAPGGVASVRTRDGA